MMAACLRKPGFSGFCLAGTIIVFVCVASVLSIIFISPKPPLMDGVHFGAMVLDSKGHLLKLGLSNDEKYRIKINLDEIAPETVSSLIQYEDKYFYTHPGVNPLSILRAVVIGMGGGRWSGASTITMQVARLRYRLKTSGIAGKVAQIWQAFILERHYSKQEILEAYFNLAPYGGNIEGIEAAARIYFNKSAHQLTDSEAHALTVVPQNPVSRNPVTGAEFDKARIRFEKYLASSNPEAGYAPLKIRKPSEMPFLAPHVSLELFRKHPSAAINTGIERELQVMLEQSLRNFTQKEKRFGIENAAAMLVDSRTMHVCALAGSADFFNDKISGQIDGSLAKRSPGSTLKPFIYALALDQGLIHPMTILPDSPRSFGGYDPENFDRDFRGPLSAHEALKSSRNLPAIYLAEKLAYPGLYGFMEKAGIKLPHGPDYYGLALALGGAEISMRELAALYAMLANKGLWQPLKFEKRHQPRPPVRMLSPEASWLALWMLDRQDSYIQSRGNSIPLYYKTGTSNGFRDAWTAGVAGNYVLVVWVGNFDNRSNPYFVGTKTALPLFREIAQSLAARRPLHDVLENDDILNLETAQICISTGDFDNGHCDAVAMTKYIPGISPVRDSGILKPILIDKKTGKRSCAESDGETEEVWWEFWPTEMMQIFAKAGIKKAAVPEWLPQCEKKGAGVTPSGKEPRIIFPKKNVVYQRRMNEVNFQLPLKASVDADVSKIHWYANSSYLGEAAPGDIIFWKPEVAGRFEIMVVDNTGRSKKQICDIVMMP